MSGDTWRCPDPGCKKINVKADMKCAQCTLPRHSAHQFKRGNSIQIQSMTHLPALSKAWKRPYSFFSFLFFSFLFYFLLSFFLWFFSFLCLSVCPLLLMSSRRIQNCQATLSRKDRQRQRLGKEKEKRNHQSCLLSVEERPRSTNPTGWGGSVSLRFSFLFPW